MGKGQFAVSFELLKDMLHLPDGSEILEVHPGEWRDKCAGQFRVLVVHPDIPEALKGAVITKVNPTHQATFEYVHHDETKKTILFKDWGLPE